MTILRTHTHLLKVPYKTASKMTSKISFLAASILSVSSIGALPMLMMTSAHAEVTAESLEPLDSMTAVDNQQPSAPAIDDFMKCTELKLGAARLACYDKVTLGQEVTVGRKKTPIDITKSVKASITGLRPTAVYADVNENLIEQHQLTAGAPTETGNQKLAQAGVTVEDFSPYTTLSLAYDLDENSEQGTWTVRPHNPIYLLPAFAHFDPNRSPHTPTQEEYPYTKEEYEPLELKAQISLKTKVAEDLFDTNADVWFGYTQQMHWQVYNEDNSRPFRATDYMPEFFITQPVTAKLPFNGRLRMLGAGAIHHSNGQSDPLSRSWNRIYLMGGAEWGKLSVIPKIWTHVKNESDSTPSDNPDITDYYGHGEVVALYNFGKGETLSATGRYNFDTDKGAIQLDYTHPLTRDLEAFIQIFHGYGESIIDYNDETTAVGIGLSLSDWKGL